MKSNTYSFAGWSLLPIVMFFLFGLSAHSLSQINKLDPKNLEQTMRNPWKPDRSVFLQEWLILGPIPIHIMKDIDSDFLSATGGEARVHPTEGQAVKVEGAEMKWKGAKCKDIFDLQEFFRGGKTEDVVAYAYTTITRKEGGQAYFTMGSDDGVKVWVNGVMVHKVTQLRGLTMDEDGFPVSLKAGENQILLKIQQAKGGWAFAVRLIEGQDQLNYTTGAITFSLSDNAPREKTLTIQSRGNLNQAILKQTATAEAYGAGGNVVATITLACGEPVSLDYAGWPDGVYEFRFAYKNIRGEQTFAYTSWFKGDIMAEARKIVESAPDKTVRTPQGAAHRMLADMILDRLGGNLSKPDSAQFERIHSPLMEFAEMQGGTQVRPGGFVRLTYIDDIDNTPQFCRSYLPVTYDARNKTPLVVFLHGYNGDNPEYINWWSVDKRHDPVSDKHNVIFIEPHGRGNTQYRDIGERDVLKCIEMAKQQFNVDEDRVYLVGASMGGFGTWNVATRHPELFAAIAPIYGGGDYHVSTSPEALEHLSSWEEYLLDKSSSSAQLESLINMPILVSHGDQDQSVDVNLSRYLVRMLQRWDYDIRYIEVPGKGHTELGLWDQTIPWMLEHKREAYPRHVRVRSADLRTASAYWVKVTQEERPAEFMVVDAEVLDGNLIRVDSKNVRALSLDSSPALVDVSKPVNVIWNGKSYSEKNPRAVMILNEDRGKPSAVCKTPALSGPLVDFQNTPFLIVVGTHSKDSVMNKVMQRQVATIVGDWKGQQKFEPRVKKDVDVTDADMKSYSLYLLGGPSENSIAKLVFEQIPFAVTSEQITVGGKSFKARNAVLNAVYPSPFNKDRYVNIVASTSAAGLFLFDSRRGDQRQYDFVISDGKIPVFSRGAKDENILVASGFFNGDWKLDPSSLRTGDDTLRSTCPSLVVNPDLSTSIVGIAKPSVELLKTYVGMYKAENGPLVKVFVENNVLKAAQMPNEQLSVELTPTTESEFYVSQFGFAVAFEKDTAAKNTVMFVYQGGQKMRLDRQE